MALAELIKEITSQVEGLKGWTVEESWGDICMYPDQEHLNGFKSFNRYNIPINISPSTYSNVKWDVSTHWKLKRNAGKYKSLSYLIRRIQHLVNVTNDIVAEDELRKQTHDIGVKDTLKKLAPYVEEYGDIFKVDDPNQVKLVYGGFIATVDLSTECADFTCNLAQPNWVPLHMIIPFIKEVELYRLLE